jgi:hypothetical protein
MKSPIEKLLDEIEYKPVKPPNILVPDVPYVQMEGMLKIGGNEITV